MDLENQDFMTVQQVNLRVADLKNLWRQRNIKFKEWYEILVMLDTLASRNLETYVSNEPQTFYDMAHYLLTRGDLSHSAPLLSETAIELDKRAKIDRACRYSWMQIDKIRRAGGDSPYLDELGFFLLVLGWLSTLFYFNKETGMLEAYNWNPYDTYPGFSNGRLLDTLHSYYITESEAKVKAKDNGWEYAGVPLAPDSGALTVLVDDYWIQKDGEWYNAVFYNGNCVDGWSHRENIKILVSPVAGFPDKGSLTPRTMHWRKLVGRSIFEVNQQVELAFNKWKTMVSQVLRDTAQPVTQEFSASPQATPEQLRERGALFHYAPGEQGLQRVPPAAIPIEIQAHMMEIRRELQKGSFNDAVWGMVEGQQPGYALSMMASSSANQILYPYMDAKHFVIETGDEFFLSKTKSSKRVFEIKGKMLEKLKPTDIPDNVNITVESEVATTKDWLERSTIANNLDKHLDPITILGEILNQSDPQAIIRAKDLYDVMHSPEALMLKKITGFRAHARFLEYRGDTDQARAFKKMADALEAQMGAPAPGQASVLEQAGVDAKRIAGAPPSKARVNPQVMPPEALRGFTPQELRNRTGRGRVIRG